MKVIARSPLFYRGRRVERGETLDVEPLTAAELCQTNRCELADKQRDGDALREAAQAAVRRALREAGQPWRQPEPSGGWRRVH